MKRNMLNVKILKKSQIIISVIALMLITAGYFNYVENIDSLETMSNTILDSEDLAAIGEAKLVDSAIETDEIIEEGALVENDISGAPESTENTITNNEQQADNTTSTSTVNTENTDDYFASSRLERSNMYSEMISTYERMIENTNVSETQKGIATNEIYVINSTKNAIMICENLIKNKGFEDVIVFVNDDSVNVIVKASDLKTEQIAQIQNIISRELNAEAENIHISCK